MTAFSKTCIRSTRAVRNLTEIIRTHSPSIATAIMLMLSYICSHHQYVENSAGGMRKLLDFQFNTGFIKPNDLDNPDGGYFQGRNALFDFIGEGQVEITREQYLHFKAAVTGEYQMDTGVPEKMKFFEFTKQFKEDGLRSEVDKILRTAGGDDQTMGNGLNADEWEYLMNHVKGYDATEAMNESARKAFEEAWVEWLGPALGGIFFVVLVVIAVVVWYKKCRSRTNRRTSGKGGSSSDRRRLQLTYKEPELTLPSITSPPVSNTATVGKIIMVAVPILLVLYYLYQKRVKATLNRRRESSAVSPYKVRVSLV